MSQPTPYTPTTDFSQQEANNASGRSTVNTAALDAEFANVETTLDQLCQNIALIQRDDGRLKDLATEIHTLSPEVLNLMGGFTLKGLWTASTAYAVNDIATNDIYTYVCTTAHTSGLAFESQYWSQFGFSGGGDAAQAAAAAQVSANNASSSASSASYSASEASSSASAASASASSASSSAATASASASAAGNSATSASNSASAAAVSAANLPNATTAGGDKFLKSNTGGTAWEYQTAAQARSSLGLGSAATETFTVSGLQGQAYTAFTTAGTSPAFTLTPSPAIASYVSGQRFRVNFNAAGTTGSNTLNVSGLGAKNLKQYDSTGAKVSGVVTSGFLADVEYDGTHLVILNPLPSSQTAITATSDPTFSDNSSSPAATNWVRGAMLAIATAAGFAISLAANGYIKFPSFLGGLIIQWGQATVNDSAGGADVTFPIAFPNAVLTCGAISSVDNSAMAFSVGTLTMWRFTGVAGSGGTNLSNGSVFRWFVIGY